MQIEVNFQDKEIADKVLWILEHFKNEEVEVTQINDYKDIKWNY